MLKNACALKNNDFVISILRKMQSKQFEPTEESIRMVDEYHGREFRSLRSYRVVSKKMRNECFKLTRECSKWKKHFRNDQPFGTFTFENPTQSKRINKKKSKQRKNPKTTDGTKTKNSDDMSFDGQYK